jgi:hypothetical protein
MIRTSHIGGLIRFADTLRGLGGDSVNQAPIMVLAGYVGLGPTSSQFARLLYWMSEFLNDAERALSSLAIEDDSKSVASDILASVVAPFRPPFAGNNLGHWLSQSFSATNREYLKLLSNVLAASAPIFLPEQDDVTTERVKLDKILSDIENHGLPDWVVDDFRETVGLAIVAMEKVPYLAHLAISDANRSIAASILSDIPLPSKKLLVRASVVLNALLAVYIMPHEAAEATDSYYQWLITSQPSATQMEKQTVPLSLPAPAKGTKPKT